MRILCSQYPKDTVDALRPMVTEKSASRKKTVKILKKNLHIAVYYGKIGSIKRHAHDLVFRFTRAMALFSNVLD